MLEKLEKEEENKMEERKGPKKMQDKALYFPLPVRGM